ncbi:MAG: winged helix-turn-helix domain-containing protein [Candidatus Aenigmarchaeota archaeon]|nr:winged helix DNA-binding protein [Candidatus Aenigmarchaeota archaeon]MCX8190795.1 winged helix DNA-binding protein [Candidatus Aenigmarchaeota archaeon]MDW8160042.1 winged helix-turn-helix domain-containing protein [Candidatus Aenigmarchaeota archaeon]
MKEEYPHKIFLRFKPTKLLVTLREGPKNITMISKSVDLTYSHTIKILDLLNELGLIEFEEKGRIKVAKLTDLGEDLARSFDVVLTKLSKLKRKI